jgi:hypothetical protein
MLGGVGCVVAGCAGAEEGSPISSGGAGGGTFTRDPAAFTSGAGAVVAGTAGVGD